MARRDIVSHEVRAQLTAGSKPAAAGVPDAVATHSNQSGDSGACARDVAPLPAGYWVS